MIDLFIVAGEPSGDLQGSKIIEELFKIRPDLKIGAVAGPRMRSHPIETFFPMENLQVMGFIDVIFALPKIIRQFFAIRKKILELQPKAVICIDYPGFNIRLEQSLRKKGYRGKLIHYVCPTVWAWGKKTIPKMAKTLDLLIPLFPFEKKCFEHTSLPVKYFGHPLISAIRSFIPDPLFRRGKIFALFPGSRKTEIERNFHLQLKVARKLQELDSELQIAVSIAHPDLKEQIRSFAPNALLIPPEQNYDLMHNAHLALAKSGTVTLELALHNIPTIVNFAIRPIDVFIAQKIFRIDLPFYCIVNIIGSKEIFPEFFGPNLTEQALFSAAKKLWFDESARKLCSQGCKEVKDLLGSADASSAAAQEILKTLN